MPVPIDETSAQQIDSALVAGVAEIRRLSRVIEKLQARIDELEQSNTEVMAYVEPVVCSRSGYFTGEPPYVGWRGMGFALEQDYDELDELRARVNELSNRLPSEEGPEEASPLAQARASNLDKLLERDPEPMEEMEKNAINADVLPPSFTIRTAAQPAVPMAGK